MNIYYTRWVEVPLTTVEKEDSVKQVDRIKRSSVEFGKYQKLFPILTVTGNKPVHKIRL